ncbi:MAG: outer membrane protein assembly factor, partial [Gemmatimonadales bacterium]
MTRRMHGIARSCWLALVASLGVAIRGEAQQPEAPPPVIFDSIAVEGNSRLRVEDIVSFSGLQLFQPTNYRAIQRAITNLYNSGQFDDVRIEQRGDDTNVIAAIIVKERPVLIRWEVAGAGKIEESAVRRKVAVLEGRPIDRVAVAASAAAIDSLYKKRGFYAAKINVVETRADSGNTARITFDVEEGNRVAISQVIIEGNERFPDGEVVGGMSSKPEGFWWFRRGEYSEERLDDDIRNKIPQWYADRGYVDLRVLSDTLIADSVPGKAILKIRVDEGDPYRVGNFEIFGNRRYSADELSLFFPFGTGIVAGTGEDVGVPFSRADWQAATDRVVNLYQNSGYIVSRVEPEEIRRTGADGKPIVDLRWRIFEGQPATISRIIVLGNDVTHERVIREQIVLLPGMTFNRDLLIRSYQNVSNLNFFEQPLPPPDVRQAENGVDVDLIFRVTERNTGNVNFGAS